MSTFKRRATAGEGELMPVPGGTRRSAAGVTVLADLRKVAGTRPAAHNHQLLISSGLTELDCLVGGGVPVGSLFVVLTDPFSGYAQSLPSYFMSEGMICHHDCTVVTATHTSEAQVMSLFVKSLDSSDVEPAESSLKGKASTDTTMNIAWQYEKYMGTDARGEEGPGKSTRSSRSSKQSTHAQSSVGKGAVQCHKFDLSHPMQEQILRKELIHTVAMDDCSGIEKFRTELGRITLSDKNVCRVLFNDFGSFLLSLPNPCVSAEAVRTVLGWTRAKSAATMIVAQKHQLSQMVADALLSFADIVIGFESFIGSDISVSEYEMEEYSGLFSVLKMPCLNSLNISFPESSLWFFKAKRNKLVIEKIQSAPEESRETNADRPRYSTGANAGSSTRSSADTGEAAPAAALLSLKNIDY